MDQTEAKKICRSCGEDLAHKERHESRDGTYLCTKCAKAKKRRFRRVVGKLTEKKSLLIVLYVVLAVVACLIFWTILDTMSQSVIED